MTMIKNPPIPKDRKKYPVWITTTVPVTKQEVLFSVGKKCKDYDKHCYACIAWKKFEKTGTINILVDRRKALDILDW